MKMEVMKICLVVLDISVTALNVVLELKKRLREGKKEPDAK